MRRQFYFIAYNVLQIAEGGEYEALNLIKPQMFAMLQAGKAAGIEDNRFNFSRIHLFFKDKGAIEKANAKNLSVKRYIDFAEEVREVGIILPI